jgi:hypothetical protein
MPRAVKRLELRAEGNPLTGPAVKRFPVLVPFCTRARARVAWRTWQPGWPCGVNIEYKARGTVVFMRGPLQCGEGGEVELGLPCDLVNGIHQLAAWGCAGCFWGVELAVELEVEWSAVPLVAIAAILAAVGAALGFYPRAAPVPVERLPEGLQRLLDAVVASGGWYGWGREGLVVAVPEGQEGLRRAVEEAMRRHGVPGRVITTKGAIVLS